MKPEKLFRVAGDGVAIQLGQWGGPGAPLLCVHGLTANLMCFAGMAQTLGNAHRVLAMDLRGRGGSDKPDIGYSTAQHCRDIQAVVAGLGLERVAIMGHSLGAYIGLEMAARYPEVVERLILVDGGADLTEEQWTCVANGIGPSVDRLDLALPDEESYLALMRQSPYYDPWNQVIEDYFRYEIQQVPGGVRSVVNPDHIAEERSSLSRVAPSELHPLVQCPTLVLRASLGMLAPENLLLPQEALQRMLAAMPQALVADLADADHFSIVFQPNPARDRAILDFLARP